MAGYDLKADSWIAEYVDNPEFAQYADLRVGDKSEQEISAYLDEEEYFYRRFNKTASRTIQMSKQLKIEIYDMLKYYTTNPLSLKECSRIAIRKKLLNVDFNIKRKIESCLPLPNSLKGYLLLREFYV